MTRFEPEVLDFVVRLRSAFHEGLLGATTHEVYPDLPKGSRENYLYFTLAPALNLQRRSEQLWRAAKASYDDPETRYVFDPDLVLAQSKSDLRAAMTKHSLAILTVRHVDTWWTLCSTLAENYRSDPRALLEKCGFDVNMILALFKADRPLFPIISGPKMSHYWLFILRRFTDVRLVNAEEISIIPDIHVRRATARLGIVDDPARYSTTEVAELWREGLAGSGILPSSLHGPLWLWSRAGFPEIP